MMNDKNRQIRSFVRREGRVTTRQKRGLQNYWPDFVLERVDQPYEFDQIFGRVAPLFLEVGFGMGRSLWKMAHDNPDINFIGVEVHRPGVGSLLSDIADAGLTNIKVFCEDINLVLKQCVSDTSLDRVNIYFADPWPKKRHHKRRLIQQSFVELVTSKLKVDGLLHLATDWQDYAQWIQAVMGSSAPFERLTDESAEYKQQVAIRPETKFERRGLNLGHGVWDLLYRCQKSV